MIQVQKNAERHRYEAIENGQVIGTLEYRERGEAMELPHTVVQPGHDGKGVGSTLARFALDDIGSVGRKVIPSCSFVAGYIQRHPEDAALVAP